MMCQRIGWPPISIIGLGFRWDSSLMRVPRPPARMTAFTGLILCVADLTAMQESGPETISQAATMQARNTARNERCPDLAFSAAAEAALTALARGEVLDNAERCLDHRNDHELREAIEWLQRERRDPRFQQLTISGPW